MSFISPYNDIHKIKIRPPISTFVKYQDEKLYVTFSEHATVVDSSLVLFYLVSFSTHSSQYSSSTVAEAVDMGLSSTVSRYRDRVELGA